MPVLAESGRFCDYSVALERATAPTETTHPLINSLADASGWTRRRTDAVIVEVGRLTRLQQLMLSEPSFGDAGLRI